MPYSRQTFTFRQVLSYTHVNQIEENIATHVHGQSGVTSEMYRAAFDFNQSGAGVIFKHSGLTDTPTFKWGQITITGDLSPGLRLLYSDNVTAERVLLDFDSKGIFASVRSPVVGVGPHFEGWIEGDTHPVFRLTSSPSMTLEMGPGGATAPDVYLRRTGVGEFKIFTQGVERFMISPTQLAISNVAEFALKESVNMVLSSLTETEVRFKRTGLTNNPTFKMGRIDEAEAGAPARWRILYQDDVIAERTLLRVDRDGIMELLRQGIGPHIDCYVAGDVNPYIRLTSGSGVGEIQMGAGGASSPDVNIYRKGAGVIGTDHRFDASLGLVTRVVAGAPSDAPADATMYLDNVNHRLYVRSGGVWRYTQLT